jgi:hypothetical protein
VVVPEVVVVPAVAHGSRADLAVGGNNPEAIEVLHLFEAMRRELIGTSKRMRPTHQA